MGKSQRDKGLNAERAVVHLLNGLQRCPCCDADIVPVAQRVPLSGATDYAKGDVEADWGRPYPPMDQRKRPQVYEVKVRARMKFIYDALGDNDGLVLREQSNENKGRDWLLVVRLK